MHKEGAELAEFDWQSIQRRLAASQAALQEHFAPPARAREQVMHARAAALAREPEEPSEPGDYLEIIEFLLSSERYGIELSSIREIWLPKDLTKVPGTPAFVVGLINVRAEIFSVIDIRKFFDLPEKGPTDLNRVLILSGLGMELGILADAVIAVRQIAREKLQPPPPTLFGIRADYARGLTDDALLVLDVERLLSDKRILVDEG